MKDPQFRALHLDPSQLNDTEALRLMEAYPDLLERPILERGEQAIIGRPTEHMIEFLKG